MNYSICLRGGMFVNFSVSIHHVAPLFHHFRVVSLTILFWWFFILAQYPRSCANRPNFFVRACFKCWDLAIFISPYPIRNKNTPDKFQKVLTIGRNMRHAKRRSLHSPFLSLFFTTTWPPRPSEEEQNSEKTPKSGRFAQLRGHWAYQQWLSAVFSNRKSVNRSFYDRDVAVYREIVHPYRKKSSPSRYT